MKKQMRFQKYICLAMLIAGALALIYAFCYCSGGLAVLGQEYDYETKQSYFPAGEGKYDANLFLQIQPFNNLLMYMGIAMVVFAVLLFITSCNSRRNYYITNYIATGVCAVGDIVISVVLMALNAVWLGRYKNVDFESWRNVIASHEDWDPVILGPMPKAYTLYSDSAFWFYVGFAVYSLVIIAALLLILNLVWKILLMKGEKKLLAASAEVGGEVV